MGARFEDWILGSVGTEMRTATCMALRAGLAGVVLEDVGCIGVIGTHWGNNTVYIGLM